jgi:tetratricopeptide (TPR) repeat protein
MIQRSRKPAVAVLLATCVAGGAYLISTSAESRTPTGPTLAQLEVLIADPEAGAETWLLYAQRLQQSGRYAHAALAYQRVLEADPFSRTANLQCAVALALAGDADRVYEFLRHLVTVDPRLTQDIFGRPELRRYLGAERFGALQALARVQSMD